MNIQDLQFLRQETGAGIMDCRNALNESNGEVTRALEVLREKGFQMVKKKEERVAIDGIAYAELFGNDAVLLEVNTETDFVSGSDAFIAQVGLIAKAIAQHKPSGIQGLMECTLEGQDVSISGLLQKMVLTFRENIVIRRFAVITGSSPVAYMHQRGKIGVILNLASENETCASRLPELGKELALQIAAMSPQVVDRKDLSSEALNEVKNQIKKEISEDSGLAQKPQPVLEKILSGRLDKYFHSACLLEQTYIRDDKLTVRQVVESAGNGSDRIRITGFFRYERADGLQKEGDSNLEFARQLAGK